MNGESQKPAGAGLNIQLWTEEQFAQSRTEWQALLGQSNADPLFMSWDWQWRWWFHHSKLLDADLCVLGIRTDSGELVGLAPLYRRRIVHRGNLSAVRLESIGSTWREHTGVFSEYLDLIIAGRFTDAVIAALAKFLLELPRWSDVVVSNARMDSSAARLLKALSRVGYLRSTDFLESHAATLPGKFEDFLRALNAGTRRKLWNQRTRLTNPSVEFASEDRVSDFLDRVDEFHSVRWGCRHYDGVRRSFHLDFATAMARQGALRMSSLLDKNQPLCVMYNIRLGGTEYNLQSGFDTGRAASLSPGYLHFGYCFEGACSDGIQRFDFLAGEGKARQYKQDFLTQSFPIGTLQVIRNRPLGWLYRSYDMAQRVRRANWAPTQLSHVTSGAHHE